MNIHESDERVKDLCARLTSASDVDINSIVQELQQALREHNEIVRRLAFQTLQVLNKSEPPENEPSAGSSASNAAD